MLCEVMVKVRCLTREVTWRSDVQHEDIETRRTFVFRALKKYCNIIHNPTKKHTLEVKFSGKSQKLRLFNKTLPNRNRQVFVCMSKSPK